MELGHMLLPGIRVGYDLVLNNKSFKVNITDEWSEKRSEEFVML